MYKVTVVRKPNKDLTPVTPVITIFVRTPTEDHVYTSYTDPHLNYPTLNTRTS